MKFIFQGSQKKHVRVAISQKAPVRISWYAAHFEGFWIPDKMHLMICLETVRAFPRLLCALNWKRKQTLRCLGAVAMARPRMLLYNYYTVNSHSTFTRFPSLCLFLCVEEQNFTLDAIQNTEGRKPCKCWMGMDCTMEQNANPGL